MLRIVIWVVAIGTIYTANALLVSGAYWIHRGRQEQSIELSEFLSRTALAAFGLTLLTPFIWFPVFAILGTLADFGIAVVIAVPIGSLWLTWAYALDELVDGLSVFLLFLGVPLVFMIALREFLSAMLHSL